MRFAPVALFAAALSGCSTIPLAVLERAAPPDPGGYTVTGTATIDAPPDCADLAGTLSIEARLPSEAAKGLREQQAALLADLQAAGVTGTDIAVSTLTLHPVVELVDPRGQKTRVRGYEAAVTVTVTTKDFDGLPALLDQMASHGATRVTTAFRVSNVQALRKQVRAQAATEAREKAEAVAEALGAHLGRVRQISEDAGGGWLDNNYANAYRPAPDEVEVHADTQAVTITLTVTYDLN